jgi:quercetin dioxygenase-like cupin family protein
MIVRRFSPDSKSKLPGGHPGVYAVPIQFDSAHVLTNDRAALARQLDGLPIFLDRPTTVVALYFESHGSIEEHKASAPILVLITAGSGFVRIGGPDGETRAVSAGDAILWPAALDHTLWTEDETLTAIVIDGPAERPIPDDK